MGGHYEVVRMSAVLDLKTIDVVILCGGLGKRLRPAVGESPKVMATIDAHPFLDFLLDYMDGQGFRRVILCTGYKAEMIEDYYDHRKTDLTIEYSREEEPLDTGGAIKHAQALIRSNPFVVMNGDSFCPVHFDKLLNFHRTKKACASIVVAKADDKGDFGSIALDDSGKIAGFKEKIKGDGPAYVNAGVYCFANDIFERMPRKSKFSLEHDFFPSLVANEFYGFTVEEKFMDIGTPQRLAKAKRFFKK